MTLSFVMPGTPSSLNRTRGQHWARTREEEQQWATDAHRLARDAINRTTGLLVLPWVRVDLLLLFRFAKPARRDLLNLGGSPGVKGLIDGLVAAGVMPDDSYIYLPCVTLRVQRTLVARPEVYVLVWPCPHGANPSA